MLANPPHSRRTVKIDRATLRSSENVRRPTFVRRLDRREPSPPREHVALRDDKMAKDVRSETPLG
jgi:hypothetical protein